MQSVFTTTEILEAILLYLDMTTLLVTASRVSKTWNNVIATSPAIQRALYFRPISREACQASECSLDGSTLPHWDSEPDAGDVALPILNPLLVKKFGPCFFDFGSTYGYHRRSSSFYKLPWTKRSPKEAERAGEPVKMSALIARNEEAARRPFTRRGASWRRMLVSQPPPPKLGYSWMYLGHGSEESQTVWMALWEPKSLQPFVGLRMGELYDFVQYHAGHHDRRSLWFRVIWGQPKEPFTSDHSQEICQRILARTHVVVEFHNFDDGALADHPRAPANVETFDAIFRCDEYTRPSVQTEAVTAEQFEFPGFDHSASIK